MPRMRVWGAIALITLAVFVVACNQGGGGATEAPSTALPAGVEPGGQPVGQAGEQTGEQASAPAAAQVPQMTEVPQIASGTMPALMSPTPPPPRPTTVGLRRIVPIDEAVAGVPFQLLEPKELPPDTNRDVVHLEVAPEGETIAGLPAVRFIYTALPNSTIVVYERAADGSPGTGETVDIGGATGWMQQEGSATVIEWEQDGVRIQLRGIEVDQDALLAAARSMGPVTPGGD